MNKEKVFNEFKNIFEQYEIDKVWLFGSFLKGNYNDQSDIDIVYERSGFYSLNDNKNIIRFIAALQDNSFNREVDVTNYENIVDKTSRVATNIKNEMILIYDKEGEKHD